MPAESHKTSTIVSNEPQTGFSDSTDTVVNTVTSFSDQQGVATDKSALNAPNLMMDAYDETTLQQFIGRPYVVDQFSWTTASAQFSELGNWAFPYELMIKPQIKEKLANFNYFRANLRISLRVNSTRFHYGRLLLCFFPNEGNTEGPIVGVNFVRACSLPHLQVSATEASTTELFVPFSLPFEYIDLFQLSSNLKGAKMYEMGRVHLFVMNELRVPEGNSVSCTLFANFEDVHVAGFSPTTFDPFTPENLVPPLTPTDAISFADLVVSSNPFSLAAAMQAGEIDQEQQQKSEKGLVSGIAETVASFAAPLSFIPGIGQVAEMVATGASAVGGLAKVFGYEKPISQLTEQPFITRFPVLAHGKGLETAPTMGTFPDNKVAPNIEYIGGMEDEMQVSRVVSTPGFIGTFNITESSGTNDIVYDRFVTPIDHLCSNPSPDSNLVHSFFTPLAYTSAAFEYWRGSLRYYFQVVASTFHSCRIRICWVPPGYTSPTDPDQSVNLVNHVLDINTDTTVCISIPYLNSLPWLTVPAANRSPYTELGYSANGRMFVQIVNPITYPYTPVEPISINVWCSAGPDFQLAFPTDYRLFEPGNVSSFEGAVMQAGCSLDSIRTEEYPPILKSKYFVDENLCHGEHVTHLKHLMQRLSTNEITYAPGFYRYNGFAGGQMGTDAKYTFVSWFQRLFRYSRGSTGVRLIGTDGPVMFQNRRVDRVGLRVSGAITQLGPIGVGSHYVPGLVTFIPEAITPYYSSQYGIPNSIGLPPFIVTCPAIDFEVGGSSSFRIAEFVGDDFVMGYMIGAPLGKTDLARWYHNNTS